MNDLYNQVSKLAVDIENHITDELITDLTKYLRGFGGGKHSLDKAIKLREMSNKCCDIQQDLAQLIDEEAYNG